MMARLGLLLTLTMLAAASGAEAQDRRDTQLADRVGSAISQYPRYTIFDDINGTVEHGVVTLTGKVTMPFKRNDVQQLVSRIDGVQSVNNQIEVLPTSIFDDQLRSRIARAIYGSSAF
jgi:hyperosmotically inducible protein